jgi:SagB-type dehydrogenase family enzyme
MGRKKMAPKLKWFLNAVLTISVVGLILSGLALYFQVWIDGIRELHKTTSFIFIAASILHMILNWKALWLSLKNKWAIGTMLVILAFIVVPLVSKPTASKPQTKPVLNLTDIVLPAPHQVGGKPLMQALKERQSIRAYADKKLPEQTIADLMWAAFGINRPDSGKRTAPSAQNWQEIELYALTPDGAYVYDPQTNRLHAVLQGDQRKEGGMQGFVATASLVLVYVANRAKTKGVSDAHWALYSGVDTGYISQNVYLFCASEGLATVVLGSVDREALGKTLGLPPEKTVVLTQPVGYPR